MSTQVVLLRGVNVGGHNKVPLADFRALLEAAGGTDVQTYVQSGNAVLTFAGTPAELERATAAGLERELDLTGVDLDGFAPERVAVGERALYLFHADGVQNSRLARLTVGTAMTARNWRTVTALHALTLDS
ncbi:MAG: DUF1697 domain-containing protein [Frankiales bacterium]|nr:DUF1697 domain-containing protein [Frankiales bacterium]